ncbi:hypothetical protein PHPALM_862 [Phytophthora palmivora]|uniref:Uncharacterized protein n=1 Tax=Phytophthora palmivora TaxID=4796 RepID=A0A2P4YTS4_9STRA|nr:hypothetical protein PHPALM_862 [Phytophthora palmivora]
MSMKSLDDEDGGDHEDDNAHAPLIWDLSDRNTVRKVALELVEDEEDEETFEDANDEEDDESKEYVAQDGEQDIDRLTQLSAKSADSYASVNDFFRGDTRVFRDTELDRATELSDTFLTSTSPSSIRGLVANDSFLVDDDAQNQEQEQQQKEEQEEDHDQHDEKRRGSGSSRRKKKSRSKKSRK